MELFFLVTAIAYGLSGGFLGWQIYRYKTVGPHPETESLIGLVEPKIEQGVYNCFVTLAWAVNFVFLQGLKLVRYLTSGVRLVLHGAEKKVGQAIGRVHRQYTIKKRNLPIGRKKKASNENKDTIDE